MTCKSFKSALSPPFHCKLYVLAWPTDYDSPKNVYWLKWLYFLSNISILKKNETEFFKESMPANVDNNLHNGYLDFLKTNLFSRFTKDSNFPVWDIQRKNLSVQIISIICIKINPWTV